MKKLAFLTILATMMTSLVFAQTRETRNVGSFTGINFRVPGKLYLKQGSTQKVELEGKSDILKEIETNIEGSKLVIEKDGKLFGWEEDDDIKVYITMPNIDALNVSGSGSIIGEGKINADDLDLKVSGSGSLELDIQASGDVEGDVSGSGNIVLKGNCESFNSDVSGSGKVTLTLTVKDEADFGVSGSGRIEASGRAAEVKASISGSGKVLAADMQANRCDVKISGSGDVEINVVDELDATISGSGSVRYKGDPKKVNSHSAGSGSVRKL